jgi:hypothetical protein
MPTNLTIANGFYPVVANGSEAYSIHGEALLLLPIPEVNYTVKTHVKTLHVQGSGKTNIVVDSMDVRVIGNVDERPSVENIYVLQRNLNITNINVNKIVLAQGLLPGTLYVNGVDIKEPLQIAPKINGLDINLENATFIDVTGNYISLLHHSGVVHSSNSDILWLPRSANRNTAGVESAGNGSNLNVASLTGIFGAQYQVEQAAGTIVTVNLQAQELFNTLLIPTLILAGVCFFGNLDKLIPT